MNGAETLMRTAREAGLEVCFANPGTTEMPMVMALDTEPGIRPVLVLHETVCSGAADGYGRMAGKPAMTITHLGPGFANSIANQHNARRAFSPVFNVIGEHATWHISADAPLTMDIASLAGTVSGFVRTTASPATVPRDIIEAIAFARGERGRTSTLIFPWDHQSDPTPGDADRPRAVPQPLAGVRPERVEASAAVLSGRGRKKALLLGGTGLTADGLAVANRIAHSIGADLIAEPQISRIETGAGTPKVLRMPYFPDQARDFFAPYDAIVIAGTRPPVAFFGYPDLPSRYFDGHDGAVLLAGPTDDAVAALQALADELGASKDGPLVELDIPAVPKGKLDAETFGRTIAAVQPENAIAVVTAVTTGRVYAPASASSHPHTQLFLCGGAIGEGPALSAGAAIACPDRKVINVQADGSAAYIVQAFWTQARENLDVVTVIASNRRYAILQAEMTRAGLNQPGPNASSLTDLVDPALDWVSIAKGFGVSGERAETAEALADALKRGLAEPGPYVIEAMI